ERWQTIQLRNLLKHAVGKSAFWRGRIGSRTINAVDLAALPILTRSELREQVKSEGALLANNPIDIRKHATSGSTGGVPAEFFVSRMNAQYNEMRSTAQYFLEGRDLALNRVRLYPKSSPTKNGFSVQKSSSWMGALDPFLRTGTNKFIEYLHP